MKSTEQTSLSIESLKKQLEDTKLRLALLEYQQREDAARQAAWDSLPPDSPEKQEEEGFFARTQAKTLRLIKQHERRAARKTRPRHPPRALAVAAAAILILFLTFGTALAVSPALRVQVMRLMYQVTPEYTEVHFAPDEGASFEVPAEWMGLYYPAFIPEGYAFYGAEGTRMPTAAFTGEDDKLLRFSEFELIAESNINSEGYTVEEVDINGAKGVMSWKEGYTIMVWPASDRFFMLDVTENRDIALNIARSVIRIK